MPENGIENDVSMRVFDKMEKFASYGFNKSHAAAYGYLSYVTAYLKANYPREWMAALLTCDRDDISKVAKFIGECQSMEIPLLPPDVNEAGRTFIATTTGIRFALNGIKGVGENAVFSIVEERRSRGPYKNLYDFIKRIDKKIVGKKLVEHLIDAGGFDFTEWSRHALNASVEEMFEISLTEEKNVKAGVMTFFNLMGNTDAINFDKPPVVKEQISRLDRLLKEKELLGFFLSGHPLDMYKDFLKQLSCVSLDKVEGLDPDSVIRSAFLIEDIDTKISKNQKKFAILKISDGLTHFEVPVWADLYEEKAGILKKNQLLYAVLTIERNDGSLRLGCRWLDDLTKADEAMMHRCDAAYDKAKMFFKHAKYRNENGKTKKESSPSEKEGVKVKQLMISCDMNQVRFSDILTMKELFSSSRGQVPVSLHFFLDNTSMAKIEIDVGWGISPSEELKKSLQKLGAVIQVEEEK